MECGKSSIGMFATKGCDMIEPLIGANVLHQQPFIAEYHNFVPEEQCQDILNHVKDLSYTQGTVRVQGKRQINLDQRRAWTHKISDADPECLKKLPRQISQWLKLPNEQWIENSLLIHYPPGGEFKVHTDVVSTHHGDGTETNRVATVIVYLNQDYKGGRTVFPCLRMAVEPQAGKALFFVYNYSNAETNAATVHYGQKVDGDKYVLIFFIRDNEYPDSLRDLSVY